MQNKNAIRISNLTKTYPSGDLEKVIFKNLFLKVDKNKFYCILGPSGSGKTTLLNILTNIVGYNEGKIEFTARKNNKPIRISYVFQDDRLLPWKTVFQNLELVLKPIDNNAKNRSANIHLYLKKIGLMSKANMYPGELSGGEKQRVNLARALVVEPDIIFMDEPFSHLDELTATNLRTELLKLWEAHPKTVLMVTHNILEAVYLADRVLIINNKNKSSFIEVPIKITRSRSNKFLTEFIFDNRTQKLIKLIRSKIRL